MTNREKYAKEILDIVCAGCTVAVKNGVPCKCCEIACRECDFNGISVCRNDRVAWFKAEYAEPVIDWSKVPIDTPVWVRDSDLEEWHKSHFAGYNSGLIMAFNFGRTSWSGADSVIFWKYAKLATYDELDANNILRAYGEKEG